MNDAPLVFEGLLSLLQRQGFAVGMPQYLRLHSLLARVGDQCAPEDLKTLLCPIFATDEHEQQAFYRIFDEYFRSYVANDLSEPERLSLPTFTKQRRLPRIYVAIALVLLLIIIGALLSRTRWRHRDVAPLPDPDRVATGPTTLPKTASSADRLQETAARNAANEIFATALDAQIVAASAGAETSDAYRSAQVALEQALGEMNRGDVDPSAYARASTRAADARYLFQLAADDAKKRTPAREVLRRGFIVKYGVTAKTFATAIPLLLGIIYDVRRRRRHKLAIERFAAAPPPYSWPISVVRESAEFLRTDSLSVSSRRLRRRREIDVQRLDLERTIAATVEACGHPEFRYRPDTAAPEYLILVERHSPRDHQAAFYAELIRELESEGVFCSTFYFEADPRVCYSEQNRTVQLLDLVRSCSGHRLIIASDGDCLRDPISGAFASWTTLFAEWSFRAILTPFPTAEWGDRETLLAERFIVGSGTLDGLAQVGEWFDRRATEGLVAPSGIVSRTSRRRPDDVVVDHLEPQLADWVAACAVYPELHWSITLTLGKIVFEGRTITDDAFLKIAVLPWFRSGAIPDARRLELLDRLTPETEARVRTAVAHLLEQSVPPEGSLAAEARKTDLLVQQVWFSRSDPAKFRAAVAQLKHHAPSERRGDVAVAKLVDVKGLSRLALVLPESIARYVFGRRVPFLRYGSVITTVTAFLCALLVWAGTSRVIERLDPRSGSHRSGEAEAPRQAPSRPTIPAAAPAEYPPAAATTEEPWLASYKAGLTAADRNNWKGVEAAMHAAIVAQTREQLIRSAAGDVPYVPHYWLGLANYRLGRNDAAMREWTESVSQHTIKSTRYFSSLSGLMLAAQTELAKNAVPSSGTAPQETAVATASGETILPGRDLHGTVIGATRPAGMGVRINLPFAEVSARAPTPEAGEVEVEKALFFAKKYADLKEYSSAYEQYSQAYWLGTERPEILYNMALALAKAGRYAEASANIDRYLQLFGATKTTRTTRRVVDLQLEVRFLIDLQRKIQAEADYRQRFNRGEFLYYKGDEEGALKVFERAGEQQPSDPAVVFNEAVIHEKLRNFSKAIERFRRYRELTPDAATRVAVDRRIFRLEEQLVASETSRAGVIGAAESQPLLTSALPPSQIGNVPVEATTSPPAADESAQVVTVDREFAFISYEMARVREILAATTAISDDDLKSNIFEACMQRLQLLSNLSSIATGAGKKGRVLSSLHGASDESSRIELVTKLFGSAIAAHWAPTDASDVVLQFGEAIVSEPAGVLHDASGKFSAADRQQALYLLLARSSSLTGSQEVWLSELIESLLAG